MRAKILRTFQVLTITISLVLSGVLTASADYPGTIYTPNGTAVSVTIMTYELTPWEIQGWRDWVATYYPHAQRIVDASRKYNCHSYAWHSQSASNKWINTPEQKKYWQDGSYVKMATTHGYVAIPSSVPDGAKVSYDSDDHSAIKQSQYYFRSKWGRGPVMIHGPNHCPYDGIDLPDDLWKTTG